MAAPTAAQNKLLNCDYHVGARTDLVVEVAADSAQNTVGMLTIQGGESGLSLVHSASDYVTNIVPTVAAYPNAKIGARCRVFTCADAATVTPTDYEEYLLTINGWEKIVTEAPDTVTKQYTVVTDLVDTAVTLTGAQVAGGVIVATPTANRSQTLPAASALLAAIGNAKIGTTVPLVLANLAAATHTETLVASSSITNGGIAGSLVTAAASTSRYLIRFTNVTTGAVAAVIYPA
jgi:hypothetical protein